MTIIARKNCAAKNSAGTSSRIVRVILMGAAASWVTSAAVAQSQEEFSAPLKFRSNYFGYAASVSPRVAYSDNIELQPEPLDRGSGIFSTLFNASAIYSNRRFTGIVDGDLDLSYLSGDSDFVVNQRVGATGTATLAENLLYFDVSGSTARQLVGDNARFSSNINAARSQRRNVHSFSLSPYLNREFKDGSAAELRYRYSQVFIGDDDADSTLNSFLNDSTTQEVIATYQSGRLLDRLKFSLTAYGNRTDEDGAVLDPTLPVDPALIPAFTYEQGSLIASAEYALNERFALTGTIGYDEIETDAPVTFLDGDDLSGLFWRAGFRARPGRKTDLRLEYGRRYDDDFIDASFNYRLSRRLSFNAGASRTFQTRAQSISTQFRAQQRRTLDFADSLREGAELSPRDIVESANRVAGGSLTTSQTVGIGVSNNVFAGLTGLFGRTEVSAQANYQDTDFGFRAIETLGGTLSARHQLSRRLSAYGDVFYRLSDTTVDLASCIGDPTSGLGPAQFGLVVGPGQTNAGVCQAFADVNGRTNTVGGRLGASYRIFSNVSAFGEVGRTERFSRIDALEYSENTISAGLIVDF